MKIDFEVNEPGLGKNLHEAFTLVNESENPFFEDQRKITWGMEAFGIAQLEIADFDAFPDIDDEDEGTYVRTVVGRINGQVYATTLVYHDYGISTGHPVLIEDF